MQKKLSEIFLAGSDVSNLEEFLVLLRDAPGTGASRPRKVYESAIHSIHVIGFHHKQGSIVEFSYPEEVKCDLLSYLAMPDCVHNETVRLI